MTAALSSLMHSFGGLILVKSTLLLGLVFVSSFALRRASASTQHYLWTMAFAALLALPLLSYLSAATPAWRIDVPVLEPAPTPLRAPAVEADDTVALARDARTRSSEPTEASSGSTTWPVTRLSWQPLWLAGATVFFLRLLAGVWASRRARRLARELKDEQWLDLLGDAQARMGALQEVELRKTSTSELPMTIGILRPSILLPSASDSYPLHRRWAVLLHELAHVRRRDCLTQLVCQTACAVFWWHPLAWLGARRMRALSERASDDLVLDAGAKPSEYAHDLLDMARGLTLRDRGAPIASVTMAHRSRLEERLLAILDPAAARRVVPARLALPAALAGFGILVSVALATPTVAVSLQAQAPFVQATSTRDAVQDTDSNDDPDDDDDPPQELTEAQKKAREALAEALDDQNASVREEALDALVRLRDERAIPFLLEALEGDDAQARADAAWGLGQMRRHEAVPNLIRALADDNDDVREQTAWSLGMLRSDEAVDALGVVVMSDRSSNAREQAAWALGMIRNAAAVDALVDAVLDNDANVRSQAAWALGMIRDPRALPGLAKALQDDDVDVREQAIWAMGMLRSRDSLEILISALGDSSAEIRSQAAWALGKLGDARSVDALSQAMRDVDADVREQAAWALGRLSGDNDGDHDVDLDLEMDLEMELDNVNPNPPDNVNPNPNPPGSDFDASSGALF